MKRLTRLCMAGIFSCIGCWCQTACAQKIITDPTTTLTQNFDALETAGTGLLQAGGIFAEGWSFVESGSNADAAYRTGSGSSNTGDTYSFGVAGVNPAADRALGMLQSGSLSSTPGFKLVNKTGQPISSLTIGFTGEVWRLNSTGDKLFFSYQLGDVPLNSASGWIAISALDFSTPVTGTGEVDGNNPANRTVVTPVTILGLYIPDGTTVTCRWVDATASSSAGMAIDDFTLSLIPASSAYFRSQTSGNWNSAATWESSGDNLTWSPATTAVPTSQAASVLIATGHTVTVDADLTISNLRVQPGGKLLQAAKRLIVTDSPGDDVVLEGTNSVFEIAASTNPVLDPNATFRIGSGAVLLLSGNSSVFNYHTPAYTYADEAVFEYSNGSPPGITGTFFAAQEPDAVPVLRYSSAYAGALGSSGATVINGKVEVTAGKTFNLSAVAGTLVLRNGFAGAGNLQAAATILLTGPAAVIGGSGLVNSNVAIENGCATTLLSDKQWTKNNRVDVRGTFDLDNRQMQTMGGTAAFVIASSGVVKTANAAGLVHASGSLKTGSFSLSFATGSTVEYTASGDQTISTSGVPAYQRLLLSGPGKKTVQAGANLIVQGSCSIADGATMALTGSATENLYLNNNATLQILSGGTFDSGGESAVTASSGSPSVVISGRFITRDQQGFIGTNTSLPSIVPVLQSACTVEYGRSGDQAIQATLTYENLVCSGSGTKTPANALALNGTLTLTGTATLDGSFHTIGGAGNNLVMTGTSRFLVGGTGTRPALTGTYTLSPATTLEFSNSNTTACTIRQGAIEYANIEISGSNVAAPGSGISLQKGAVFTVRSNGVFRVSSVNGLYGTVNAAVLRTNEPTLVLEPGSTVDYNGSAQVLSTAFAYSQLMISGTGSKTAADGFTVAQKFIRSGDAALSGYSPVFAPGATLAYVEATTGKTYLPGPEWPLANAPTNLTVDLGSGGAVVLGRDQAIDGLLTLTAGTLDLNGKALTAAGGITGKGTLTGSSTASLTVTGGTATVYFTPTVDGATNALKAVTVGAGTMILGNALHLYELLNIEGGTLDLNDQSLVLKSNAAQTARVAERKGILLGATNVTVERYIDGSLGRKWRLVTAPVRDVTINAGWQEGMTKNNNSQVLTGTSTAATPTPGYGTLITGGGMAGQSPAFTTAAAANAAGYDFWDAIAYAQSSIRQYVGNSDWTAAMWMPISSTRVTGFNNHEAYLLFVRGDRTVTAGGGGTVLRPKGLLKENLSYTASVIGSQSHTLIGNPYASPLNFYKLYTDPLNTGKIQPYYWVWQSSLTASWGGYALIKPTAANAATYESVPDGSSTATAADPIISSGQGFFVVPQTVGVGSTLTLRQTHKDALNSRVAVFRQMGRGPAKLFANVYSTAAGGEVLLDGVLAELGESTTRGSVGKALQNGENLSVLYGGRDQMVAAAALPHPGDTLQLRLWNTAAKDYRLRLRTANFELPGLRAALGDRFLKVETALSPGDGVTSYAFRINGEAGSKDPLRFYVVFSAAPLPAVTLTAREQYNGVALQWEVAEEEVVDHYELERSTDGGSSFQPLTSVAAGGSTTAVRYPYLDSRPAMAGDYRVKLVGVRGVVAYSGVVHVELRGPAAVRVYPNPVRGPVARVQFMRKAAGHYTLRLYSPTGQQVAQQRLGHSGGTASYALAVQGLANGSYTLEVSAASEKTEKIQVVITH